MKWLIVIFFVLKMLGVSFIGINYSVTLSDIGIILYITGTVLHEVALLLMNDKIEMARVNKND